MSAERSADDPKASSEPFSYHSAILPSSPVKHCCELTIGSSIKTAASAKMDLNSIKDQVSNLSLYDLKAGVRKVQNGRQAEVERLRFFRSMVF